MLQYFLSLNICSIFFSLNQWIFYSAHVRLKTPSLSLKNLEPISLFYVLFYLPFLSSIHEKANCIAMLWTGSPHSLGSCLFRGLWATCLPRKGGGIPLSALPKDTTRKLAGLFSTTSHKCRAPSREAIDTIF